MLFIIVSISWNNKSAFDTIDERCKHENYEEVNVDNTVPGKQLDVLVMTLWY